MEHAPIIDRETIDMLREMDAITQDDLLLELIDDFLEHAAGTMTAIRTSAQVADYRKIATHAHSLKGASLNIGVLGLFHICDQIETLARSLAEGNAYQDMAATVATRVIDLEPTYTAAINALTTLRMRTSRGETIDDLLCS